MFEITRMFMARKLRNVRHFTTFCLLTMFAYQQFSRPTSVLKPNHVDTSISISTEFTAVGKSSRFPIEWEKGKVDPFYDLVLVGDETSPGKMISNPGCL